ncbi:MAG: sulfatase-like hydrolase/transferase [Spirochaetia bacterium]|nr:sulfatase-like hydrolase/transferase [Spirochaetia bacterium]
MQNRKPNILLIVTDHQLHYRHGWNDAGDQSDEPGRKSSGPIRPHFDSLAREGMLFNRAYAVTPLCGPARRSLLTGLYPHHHRNFHNQSESPFVEDTYLDLLAARGYRNYYYGKWHAGPGTAFDHHCEGFSLPGYGNPYITDEYSAYLKRKELPRAVHRVDHLFWHGDTGNMFPDLFEGADHYLCQSSWCGETALGATVTPKETHECFFLADLACRQLDAIADQKSDQPFHLRVDFWGPHQPYFPTDEYLDLYDPEAIPEYGSFRDDLADKPEIYRNMNHPIADSTGKLIIPSIYTWHQWQIMLAKAFAQTTMVDDAASKIISKLDDLGFRENTIVIWTSDHGDALASHGGQFDKGSFMTEEIIRIPLAVRYPGFVKSGAETAALVNTIDIAPTLLDCAGVEIPQSFDGKSFLPVLAGENQRIRDEMLLETYGQGYRDAKCARTLITDRYKYTYNEDDIDELYDLLEDPYELHNLAEKTTVRNRKNSMKSSLQQLMNHFGDPDMAIS